MNIKITLFFILITLCPKTYANLISCENSGIFDTGCSINDINLLSLDYGLEEKYDFEVSFNLKYSFQCQGHNVEVGFESDLENSIGIASSEDIRTIELKGKEFLAPIAISPESFYRASLRNCNFNISNITATPSLNTLKLWEVEATYQTKIINNLIKSYNLATQFESFVTWSRSSIASLDDSFFGESGIITSRLSFRDLAWNDITNLNGDLLPANEMPAEWKNVIIQFPEMIDLMVIGVVIKSIKRDGNIPIDPDTGVAYDSEKLEKSAIAISNVVSSEIKERLLEEQQLGLNIIERARKWNQAIDDALQEILNRISDVLR